MATFVQGRKWQRSPSELVTDWRKRVSAQWEVAVGALPVVYTRGRRVPLRIAELTEMAATLESLDDILGDDRAARRAARKAAADRKLAEEDAQRGPRVTVENGRVMWWTRPKRPLTGAEARKIASGLAPDALYSLYYRMERYTKKLKEYREKGAVLGLNRGEYVDNYWNLCNITVDHRPVHRQKGRTLSPGDIERIDEAAWESAAGYVKAYFFALVPQGNPARQWLAMRDGELNCVVERVREALSSKKIGIALTPARRATLDWYDRSFKEKGCDENGLQSLASALKIKLVVRDVTGAVIWRPTDRNGKPTYEHQKEVTIYRQNGHAYASEPLMPTCVTSAVYAVPAEIKDTEALRARQLEFLAESGAGRAWTVGAEIVTEDGTVYRPPGMEDALNAAMGEYGEAVDTFDTPITRLGGVRAYRFVKWLQLNRIGHLTPKWSRIWRDSAVEARVWNCLGEVPDTKVLDISAAYLGCGEGAAENALARIYARRHGFPGVIYKLYAVSELDAIRALAGAVHVVEWELLNLHAAAVRTLAGHLDKREWLPIPLALYLVDNGLARLVIDCAAISIDRLETLQFPNRDLAVELIGSCMRSKRKNTLITRDEAEADFYVDKFLRDGRSPVARNAGGMFQVEYDAGEHKDRAHIRSYVLAYMQIAVIDALRHFGPDDVVYCSVDGLRVRATVEAPPGLPLAISHPLDPPRPKQLRWTWDGGEAVGVRPAPGIWRWKEEGPEYNYHECHAQPPHATVGTHAAWPEEGIPLPNDQIARAAVTFLDGQGGSGKSYRALRAFPGRRVVILCHNNEYAIEVAKDAEKNPYAYPTRTYHEYFHLGNKPHAEWDETTMGRERPDVVFWDEIGLVNLSLLEAVLPWLRHTRAQVVFAGDPTGQLPNFEEEKIEQGSGERLLAWLRANCDQTIMCEEDHRAKEEELKMLKRSMWRTPPTEQYRQYQAAGFARMTLDEALAAWGPDDTFVASTTGVRDWIGRMVARRNPERIRLRFAPKGEMRELYRKRKGRLPDVMHPETAELIPAAIGSVIEVSRDAVVDDQLWVPAYASTVHGMQGRTVKAPARLFVIEDGLTADWCPNIVYTIVSRVEYRAQIVRVGASATTENATLA